MSSPTLEDTCYWVHILRSALTEEMVFLKPLEDPLETCLVDTFEDEVVGCPIDVRGIFAKLLNSAPMVKLENSHNKFI